MNTNITQVNRDFISYLWQFWRCAELFRFSFLIQNTEKNNRIENKKAFNGEKTRNNIEFAYNPTFIIK